MELFFQQIINGLTLGSIYCLVALGLTLIYGIMRIPNFAHGHLYMIGAYCVLFLITLYGFNYWAAILVSMVILAVLGVLMERLVYHPMRNKPHINSFIAAIGALFFLEAIAQVMWGAEYRKMPEVFGKVVNIFGIMTTQQRLVVIFAALALMGLLHLFMKKTLVGSTIEAMAQDREGAFLVGIDSNMVSMLTFGVAAALAAAAAGLAGPLFLVFPSMGALLITKAFVIIVLGGMGSIPGAVVGAYILGLSESMGATFFPAEYKDIVAFVLLVIILSIRPNGLFAKEGA